MFRVFGKSVTVYPIRSADFPSRASRPLNSRLSKQKLADAGFQLLPDWHDALIRYAQALQKEDPNE